MIKSVESRARIDGVYFLIQNKKIVYVGQSHNVMVRVYDHLNKGEKVFDSFNYIETNTDDLDLLEAEFIVKFNPKYNNKLPSNDKYKSIELIQKLFGWDRWKLKRIIKTNRIPLVYEGFCRYYRVSDFEGIK